MERIQNSYSALSPFLSALPALSFAFPRSVITPKGLYIANRQSALAKIVLGQRVPHEPQPSLNKNQNFLRSLKRTAQFPGFRYNKRDYLGFLTCWWFVFIYFINQDMAKLRFLNISLDFLLMLLLEVSQHWVKNRCYLLSWKEHGNFTSKYKLFNFHRHTEKKCWIILEESQAAVCGGTKWSLVRRREKYSGRVIKMSLLYMYM